MNQDLNSTASAGNPPAEIDAAPLHPRLHLHSACTTRFLPGSRTLIVYVPPGYDEHPRHSYPVLYLHDGQNLFDGRTSYVAGRTWQVRESADAAIEAGAVEPVIIVGIYNAGTRRIDEYTPDRNRQLGGGHAAAYGEMMTGEIMPWVARHYRVRDDRSSTAMGGSSLGGLVSLYLGLRYPERFGKLALLSPSVWWNQKSILAYLNERAPEIWDRPRVWLDVGDGEGGRTLRDAEHLARRLKANGWLPGQTMHFERIAGGTHDEPSWAARVTPMLRFLFPATRAIT